MAVGMSNEEHWSSLDVSGSSGCSQSIISRRNKWTCVSK